MRTSDVAAFLGVSRQRVDQLVATGGFLAPRLVAGHRMWKRTSIEAWTDQHCGVRNPGATGHLAATILSDPSAFGRAWRLSTLFG